MKNILSWLTLIGGEALIIAAFIIWKGNMPTDTHILSLVIVSLVYLLITVDVISPLVNLTDRSQKQIGSLGVRWTVTYIYAFLAIGAVVLCNWVYEVGFKYQMLIHGALIILLLLGITGVLHTADKVAEISEHEIRMESGLVNLKQTSNALKANLIGKTNISPAVIQRLDRLEEEIRYISPSNLPEAATLENQLAATLHNINMELGNYEMNAQHIETMLQQAEFTLINRKSLYSN